MQKKFLLFDSFGENRRKKEIIPYPTCSVVAVFKMLIRILNTLRSRIWDMVLFLFFCVLAPKGTNAIVFGKEMEKVTESCGLF